MFIALLLVLTLIVLWYCGYLGGGCTTEGYRSCRECSPTGMSSGGALVVNPFIWPYSGTGCVSDLFILNKDAEIDFGFDKGPLTHLSTPDHAELIG